MSTPPHQTSHSDMNETAQGTDRRRQKDRRRVSGRRESDQQNPEESFQLDRLKNELEQKRAAKNSYPRETTVKSRPVAQVLSEDEIRFLLEDDEE